jgi:hypothetical protein
MRLNRGERGASLIWDESVAEPSVTFTTATSGELRGVDRTGAVIESEWAFIPLPPHSHSINATIDERTAGFVGDQVLLFGEYSMYERSVGCQSIKLYIPESTDPAEPPNEIADSLEQTADQLDVGGKYEVVRLFGVDDPARVGGRTFTHEAWVHVDSEFTPEHTSGIQYPPRLIPVNTWTHEYVHTRQQWVMNGSTASNSSWLTEAVPSYYMVSETARQNRMQVYNETRYWERLNESLHLNDQMVLTDPGTFQRQQGDYTRGAYIIAALDAEIQSQTGGEKSFDDVFKRLNEQEETTHTSFKRAVVEVGGDEMEPWIDRYVDGNETPPAPDPPLQLYLELFLNQVDYRDFTLIAAWVGGLIALILWSRSRKN